MAMGTRRRGAGAAGNRQHGSKIYEELKPLSQWINEPGAEIVHLQLPGFVKEQIRIQAEIVPRLLRVSGERLVAGNKWVRFYEEIQVPEYCEINEIRAKFEGGTLKITMPKVTPAQPPLAVQPRVSRPQQQLPQPQPPPPPQPPTRPQPVPQPQPRPQPVPQVHPRPRHQLVPQAQPQPQPQPLPQARPRPRPLPQAQPRPQSVPQAPTRPQHVPQPRHSPRKPGPQLPRTQKLPEDSPQKAALPSAFEQQKTKATTPPFPFDVPRYEQKLKEDLVQDGRVPPKAAFESEKIRKQHEKSPTRSSLPNEGEKGKDAKIGDHEHETYLQKLKESIEAELMKRKGRHVTSTEAKGKFKVEDYKDAMKRLSRNLNEDRQMLMNMCVAALVIVGLGAYISYTIGGSSGNSMD